MEIANPRRILFVSSPDLGVLNVIKDLTGSTPALTGDSIAGLSHIWKADTNYYKAEVPIWVDEISDTETWRDEFTKPEAKEVVTALGAWVFCFRKPVKENDVDKIKATLSAIQRVVEKSCGYSWDGVCLAVAMPQSTTPYLEKSYEEWDDICREFEFEYIDSEAKGKNEYGEHMGLKRLQEALEANDWGGEGISSLDDDEEDEAGFASTFAAEEAEIGLEFLGMKTAISGADEASNAFDEDQGDLQAEQVEELARMMAQLKSVRDMGAELPEEERKKFAAKAVNDMMRSL